MLKLVKKIIYLCKSLTFYFNAFTAFYSIRYTPAQRRRFFKADTPEVQILLALVIPTRLLVKQLK